MDTCEMTRSRGAAVGQRRHLRSGSGSCDRGKAQRSRESESLAGLRRPFQCRSRRSRAGAPATGSSRRGLRKEIPLPLECR